MLLIQYDDDTTNNTVLTSTIFLSADPANASALLDIAHRSIGPLDTIISSGFFARGRFRYVKRFNSNYSCERQRFR